MFNTLSSDECVSLQQETQLFFCFAVCYELLVNVLSAAQVRLYMDCEEYHRVAFSRSPQPLTFEASSGIFVGNAGGTGLARFVVSRDASWISCAVFLNMCAQTALLPCHLQDLS